MSLPAVTKKITKELKQAEEDFEWYPTTDQMLREVSKEIQFLFKHKNISLLDIGAGDGRVFGELKESLKDTHTSIKDKFAIEKSQKLIGTMPNDVIIVGTDFLQQSLLDKKVDVIFCNPPYSEYEDWARKIIMEGNAEHAFLVIPQRWAQNKPISEAIEKRKAKSSVIFSGDFIGADRPARAKIDIVHISFKTRYGQEDAFSIWFDEHFKMDKDPKNITDYEEKGPKRKTMKELVVGRNPVKVLSQLYQKDMERLIGNFKLICGMDSDILKELGVSKDSLKAGMKEKIKNLKTLYWHELFENLSQITDRLTSKIRGDFVEKFNNNVFVDFTESNAYAVIIWAINNANKYIDEQLLAMYEQMTCQENAVAYKSNIHMTKDTWRYARYGDKNIDHYKLDYRIVLNNYYAIGGSEKSWSWDYENNLHKSAHDYIGDIFTIANNLGFNVRGSSRGIEWESNQGHDFYLSDGTLFASIRCFKNGNIHVKFCKKFMQAFNVEAGKLLGWIKSPEDAAEEMNISKKEADAAFGAAFKFSGQKMLQGF